MKRNITSYLPLAALALLVAWPLIIYGPSGIVDAPNHFYRLVELSWHVRHGDLYPRWFADVYYGFGAPVLNFYAPLSYYVPLLFHLAGLSFWTAFQLSFILAVAAAIGGVYAWAHNQFGSPWAGLIASAAYSLTPYIYYNTRIRGALPEVWALALAPWLFWAAHRLLYFPSRRFRSAFTFIYAVLILTHNLATLLLTPLLVVYVLALSVDSRASLSRGPYKALTLLGVSLLQAIGLAAFYILPFVFEAQYVGLQRASLDYREFFIPLRDLFSLPIPFDPDLVRNPFPISLPLPQSALAFTAVGSVCVAFSRCQRRPYAYTIVALGLLIAALAFLTQRVSDTLWQLFPLGRLVQFPWRLIGPVSLLVAWLAAAALPHGKLQQPLAISAVLGFYFFTLTWSYSHPPDKLLSSNGLPTDVLRYEIEYPTAAGTTYQNEFLPRWVIELPSPETLRPRYDQNLTPSRLADLPRGATLLAERSGITSTEVVYDSPQPFVARFNVFYFPGWVATLDSHSQPIRITYPDGLIAVSAPAGQHTLTLSRQPTAPQVVGSLISLLVLLSLFIGRPQPGPSPPPMAASLSPKLTLLFGGLLLLRVLVLDRVETPFYRSGLHSVPNPLSVDFGDQLSLIGFDYPAGSTMTAGQSLTVALYWQSLAPITTDYHITIQLVDAQGKRFGQSDQYPGLVPTTAWRDGQYIRDEHQLLSFSGTPPGEYHLLVGVYTLTDGGVKSLNVLVDGSPAGLEYDLGVVIVTRAASQTPGPLRIVESSVAIQTVGVGDRLPFTMAFVSGDSVSPGLTAELQLIGSNGQPIFSTRFAPAGPDYPSEQWTPRELIRYPHSVDLPPDLPAGPVHLTLTFIHPDGSPASQSFELGAVTITVPERSFAIPPMSHHVDHDFGAALRLLGYDLTPETVTLYWQSLQPVSTRLTVFVHNFDASGNFIGGQDSPPPRPTTSWLPGEVITDIHQIAIGDDFEIGFYDPVTGERFGEPFSNQP